MNRLAVRRELEKVKSVYNANGRGWIYLVAFSAKIIELVQDSTQLKCDEVELKSLIYDLFNFQHTITSRLRDEPSMIMFNNNSYRSAVRELNVLKKKFLRICPGN